MLDAKQLSGFRRTATASPGEAAVVIRNGEVAGLQTEGRIKTLSVFDRIRSLIGIGPDVKVLMVDTSTFLLSYWLEDPNLPRERKDGDSLGLPVLTKDGQLVSAQISINLSVDAEDSELLHQAMRGQSSLSTLELGNLLKDQIIAQSVGIQISKHNAGDLRGNIELLKTVDSEAGLQLQSRLAGYGLRFEGLHINWGLSQMEATEIENLRRDEEKARAEHEAELADLRMTGSIVGGTIIHGNVTNSTSSGLNGISIVGLVAVVLIGIIAILVLVIDN
jgi:hypothetical protein